MTLSPYAIRLFTAAMLALTGVWLALLVFVAVHAPTDPTWWMTGLSPGCGLVPAQYYFVRRRQTADPERVRKTTGMAVMLTVLSGALMVSTLFNAAELYSA